MAKFRGAIVVDTERCKGCGVCITACPCGVIELAKEVNGKGYNYAFMANPEACIGCASCGITCPDGVIKVYKKAL
ncbi:MAG: 4Fe-4S binding protein [Bacteroidales bacterium]|jgi:2-oxoglutarate ferredoxin oxidoreductase subunit delta|nr:MAG: 2-oxoglutarate ferredoxin oxidoreductase subunit delta [bacterium P201]MBO7082335.1 4Fe-4S binding protein [Bacteroidales bacterium]MDO5315470.1 4Fe-4S binding protein [bacterium]MBQ3737542.1 4Fe-4S binding protein [Bacteroidales bacterium]MBQ8959116.1 4Fe-4S binding protein [Bacteroidales bacterium]